MPVRRECGATLLEALVSLLVLALGLLAMARLQAGNLVESRHANARALAIQLAADLKERMLTNNGAKTANPAFNPYVVSFGPAPAQGACTQAACSAQEMAAWDLWTWKQQLAVQLPQGDAQVFESPDNPGQFGVLIAWQELQSQHAAEATAARNTAAIAQYEQANAVWVNPGTQGSGAKRITCPPDRLCHLIYLRP